MLHQCLNQQQLVYHLNRRFYDHFFSYNLRLILSELAHLVAILDQKHSKSQHYSDVYNYQKNLIAHIFLIHQVLLQRYTAI